MRKKRLFFDYLRPAELANRELILDMLKQPTEISCGPTCLHAVYRYYGSNLSLPEIVSEIPMLEGGGTLAVVLGCHALRKGYRAVLVTADLHMFDPTWFKSGVDLSDKLRQQLAFKKSEKIALATKEYLEFLALGGQIRFEDFTPQLLRWYLSRDIPLLTGLSATYLYRSAREYGFNLEYDDVRGLPSGHFVVIHGYHRDANLALIADPVMANPYASGQKYTVKIDRLIGAILLGVLTHDANFLAISPSKAPWRKIEPSQHNSPLDSRFFLRKTDVNR